MITIGGKTQVFSATFMVADDQEALIDVPVEQSTLRLGITFAKSPGEERQGAWQTVENVTRFTFKGWNNSIGTCVIEPTKFGELGNRKLYFQMAHYYVGGQNLAHLFIFLGNPNE